MYTYEVHIVGYQGNLDDVPEPFFLNIIDVASQGFCGIATVEAQSINQAYAAFEQGCVWSKEQLEMRNETFGCHVKLEQTKESVKFDDLSLNRLPNQRKQKNFVHSPVIAAWDVHLDGKFHPELLSCLVEQGYILLEYQTTQETSSTTLTLHFLRQEACQEEFKWLRTELLSAGGFSGILYWEDPLAFVVYGPTIPRPVVL